MALALENLNVVAARRQCNPWPRPHSSSTNLSRPRFHHIASFLKRPPLHKNQIKSQISYQLLFFLPPFFSNPTNMDDSGSKTKLLNPWMLHFQKLALELKCPLWFVNFHSLPLFICNSLFRFYSLYRHTFFFNFVWKNSLDLAVWVCSRGRCYFHATTCSASSLLLLLLLLLLCTVGCFIVRFYFLFFLASWKWFEIWIFCVWQFMFGWLHNGWVWMRCLQDNVCSNR